jgi:hypothetical protein
MVGARSGCASSWAVSRRPPGRISRPCASVATPAPFRGPATQEMSVARHPSGRRARSVDSEAATGSLPKVPELSVVPGSPSAGGRRTADETAQFASVGRRRAPDTGELPVTGRRRAPEATHGSTGGRRRAPEGAVAATPAPGAAGRHRAPGAVDTGRAPVGVPASRTVGWTEPEGLEAELLTRPMRLSDHMQSRRPRLGGSLTV